VTGSKFHTHDQQILDTTIQNLITQATWHPGFVHLCNTVKKIISNSYKFYLKHTENWYTYITANPCHLQGLPFFKNSTNSKIILLDVKTSQKKKWGYGNSKIQNVPIYNAMLNKDKNICVGVWNDVRDPDKSCQGD